jgi:hypothetical protein
MLQPNDDFLWTRQRHEAERMGLHWDYRLVHGDKAYSFATKKELPEPGKMIVLFEQPVHTAHYALSPKVVIPTGQYGAGVTTLDWIRKAKVDPESTDDKFVIHTENGESFLIKRAPGKYGDKAWLFRNLTGVSNKYEGKANEILEKKANKVRGLALGAGLAATGGMTGYLGAGKDSGIGGALTGAKSGVSAGLTAGYLADKLSHSRIPVAPAAMVGAAAGGFVSGKIYGKVKEKAEEMLHKKASLIGGAAITHLLQNIGTNVALGKKTVSKYLANGFTEGIHGVVNKSNKSRALRVALGATLPDISVAHKSLHDAGRAVGGLLEHATPKQRVALRMLSEGRFSDLKKYNFHKDPIVRAVHGHISKMTDLPSLDKIMEKSDEVSKLWKDKSHPLLSNIATNLSRGKLSTTGKYSAGRLSAKPGLVGAAASFAIDPAAGSLNTAKGLMASKKVAENKYGKKVIGMLNNQFIKKPIKAGVNAAGHVPGLKNTAYKLGVNPLSAHLKRTSSALTDALKD